MGVLEGLAIQVDKGEYDDDGGDDDESGGG